MRCWVRRHPVTANRLQDGSAAKAILSKEPMLEANFAMHPAANPASRISGLVRWQMNPDRDWGPKPRAARSGHMETVDDRRTKGEQKAQVVRQKRKTSVSPPCF
jgi:tRNA (guanine26-N2/guanine27-N2)-dimethyltransferase